MTVKYKWGILEKPSSQGLAHVGTQQLLELFTEGFMEDEDGEQQRFHSGCEDPAES